MVEKRALLEKAFPEVMWSDEQVEAMSEFVRVCVEGGYGDEEDDYGGKKGPGGEDLLLVLGEGKPKSGKR